MWVAVPVLAAVLAVLAVLQYRWSGQVSVATRSQMQSNLKIALMGFRQDLTRELAVACLELRPAVDDSGRINPARLSQQFQHWQQAAAHPSLVSHVYLWDSSNVSHLTVLDPSSEQMETAIWPAGFEPLRERIQQISAHQILARQGRPPANGAPTHRFHGHAGRSGGHSRDLFPLWFVDQSLPAIASPLRPRSGPDNGAGPPATTWVILQMSPGTLEKEIFPELTQKYFSGPSGLDYQITVLQNNSAGQSVVYSSAARSVQDNAPVDAALNLFGSPLLHGELALQGPEMFAPQGLAPSNRPASGDDKRAPGSDRGLRIEPLFYPQAQGFWEVAARHQGGSLDAVVSSLRWRNLGLSFGVLVVLAITMAMVVITSQRARRLAMLQMDFVAGVSHELRTPLAVISSAAENIAHGVVADKGQLVRYGATIVKQSRQLSQLVDQVLVFAATQQQSQRYQLRPLDVAEAIDAALENTAGVLNGGAVTVERHVEPGLPPVAADFGALTQCLQNLITNAVKYGGERRWVGISAVAVREGGAVRELALTVEDRGIGIASSEMKHIFDPFYRSPAVAGSNIHGTGLGLPLARTLIEAMRGRLTVESELGKGTKFTIHLVVAEGEQAVGVPSETRAATSS